MGPFIYCNFHPQFSLAPPKKKNVQRHKRDKRAYLFQELQVGSWRGGLQEGDRIKVFARTLMGILKRVN
jgi:hypothetical protein